MPAPAPSSKKAAKTTPAATTTTSNAKQSTAPKKSDAAAPAPAAAKPVTEEPEKTAPAAVGFGKPDGAVYREEQEEIKKKIDALQIELAKVKEKIAMGGKNAPEGDKRTALKAELDGLRGQQANIKANRAKFLDQIKAIQESIQKKNKDLQLARQKTPFKTVAEIDAHIKQLEKQVESGSLTLADEKRALAEITTSKKSRRAVEAFQSDQDGLDSDRSKIDELRKQLDEPESKAISERFEAIKSLLDDMKEEGDKAFANRNKIYEERNKIQEQLNLLYTRKRESVQAYKEASDRHWQKMNDERAKKAERLRAQRAAEEDEKKKEITDQLREEAHQPAFQAQIEDCQTLIDSLLRIAGGGAPSAPTAALNAPKSDLAGVPKLEKRTVEAPAEAGLIARKKKGEEEEAYFVGGKGKKKNAANKPTTPSSTSASQLNMPLPTLTALLSLSIPPPTSLTDIPRTVEDLKTKKAWFEANQARQTAENIAKAEKEIKKIESGQVVPAELKPEHLGEPAPTPAVNAPKENGVASEAVDQRLDQVQE